MNELPWNIGLEDVLFNFYMGGVAWLLATCLVIKRLEVKFGLSTVIRRYLYAVLFGSAIGIPLYWQGLWGVSFGSIPLEEYLYLALFCPAWALTAAFMLDARIRPTNRGEAS